MRFLVTSIFLYACESWTLTADLHRRIQAMEVRCYRKILRISYKDHVTNEEVHATIQQATGPHEDLLTIVKSRKLQWCDQVCRSSGLAKTILQGTVKGARRQGRQRKRWEDNIRKCTGLEFPKSQRAVENRGKWRELVAKSFVVPRRPSWLRDRWLSGSLAVYGTTLFWELTLSMIPGENGHTPFRVSAGISDTLSHKLLATCGRRCRGPAPSLWTAYERSQLVLSALCCTCQTGDVVRLSCCPLTNSVYLLPRFWGTIQGFTLVGMQTRNHVSFVCRWQGYT